MGVSFVRGLRVRPAHGHRDRQHFVGTPVGGRPELGARAHPGRELREVYLHPFEAVSARPPALRDERYHELDGCRAGAGDLLTGLLRDEWGRGLVWDYFSVRRSPTTTGCADAETPRRCLTAAST